MRSRRCFARCLTLFVISGASSYSVRAPHVLQLDDSNSDFPPSAPAESSIDTCRGRKLLVVHVPGSAPACVASPLRKAARANWKPPCTYGENDDGPALQAAPCSLEIHGEACQLYAQQYADSWFTPNAYRTPHYEGEMPLQRTWLIERLTRTSDEGHAVEPCVTFDPEDSGIVAAALFHPPGDLGIDAPELTASCNVSGTLTPAEHHAALTAVRETIGRYKHAVEHLQLPVHRRFVFAQSRQHHGVIHLRNMSELFELTLFEGLKAWDKTLTATLIHTQSTFVNRGGSALVPHDASHFGDDRLPQSDGELMRHIYHLSIAQQQEEPVPRYATATSKLISTASGNYMGWPMNIDSAYMPRSFEDIEAWQGVLRARPRWAYSETWQSGDPRMTLMANNGAAHGFSACLRSKLQEACALLPKISR